jgi:hypothetical protein
LSVKYGLTSEKTIIENIAKEYKLDVKWDNIYQRR